MKTSIEILRIAILLRAIMGANGLLPGLYCGKESCYDILNVTRDTPKAEISKSYRKLAAKFHPDRHKSEEGKKEAEEKFRAVAVAYETLKDEESRKNYDYLLDHPEEYYRHYYYYYRNRVAPKVDVRLVIVATILIVSLVQYISARHKYNDAVKYLLTQQKYRIKAVELAKERGIWEDDKRKKRKNKAEAREEEEAIIRSIIEENVDIKGGYKRPSIFDTLVFQIFILPVYAFNYIRWFVRWHWRFTVGREEYGDEEKAYLIRRNLKLAQAQYDCLEEKEKQEFVREQLWIRENFVLWKKAKDEDEKKKMAESGQYKRYRRYMKNHGPGQISFLED